MHKALSGLLFAALGFAAPVSAQTLYAASGSNGAGGTLYTINPATAGVVTTAGAITISGTSIGITGLAFNPTNGTLYGVTNNFGASFRRSLVTINPATGAATLVGSAQALGSTPVGDITFDSSGVLYGWQGGGDGSLTNLVTINLSTGVTTAIGSTVTAQGGRGIAFSTVSPFTLFLSIDGDDGTLRTVDKTTGVTTVGAGLTSAPQDGGVFNSMTVNSSGTLYAADSDQGVTASVNLVTVNTSTG